jgi:cytochrome c oxidase assembly protein subunit 15
MILGTKIASNTLTRFRMFVRISLWIVLVLVVVGAFVRSSGSGMGCPDWPTCFGRWIPPTSVSELPANYQEIYANRGYADTEFNAVKTWTEYLNRLLGVITGFVILIMWVQSFYFRRSMATVFYLSSAVFGLTVLQGGVGAIVVMMHLEPWVVSVHMVIALLIVILLAVLLECVSEHQDNMVFSAKAKSKLLRWGGVVLTLVFAQVMVGTQVREAVGVVADMFPELPRQEWVPYLGQVLNVHRLLGLAVFAGIVGWFRVAFSVISGHTALKGFFYGLIACVIVELVLGSSLTMFGLPILLMPFHLVVAFLMMVFLVRFMVCVYLSREK